MTHLTESELSAHHDGALPADERARADAHLAGCDACRAALARLAAEDRALAGALSHDPGEAYFDSFAARVENRIRAAGLAGAQAREPGRFWPWLRSPRGLAWLSATAAVVVGAGVVMMTAREVEMQNLKKPQWTERAAPAPEAETRADQKAPAEPPVARELKEAGAKDEGNAPAAGAPSSADRDRGARASHVIEVKRNEVGEETPVEPSRHFAAAPPAAAPPVTEGKPVYAEKARRAEPATGGELAKKQEETQTDKLAYQFAAPEAAAATRRCGTVRDASGRPVAGAQVIVAETGASVASAPDGSFCLDVPAGARTLITMAVGFETALRPLGVDDREALALTLHAVPVVGGGLAVKSGESAPEARAKLDGAARDQRAPSTWGATKSLYGSPSAGYPRAMAQADPFAALPDSARVSVATARVLEGEAERGRSAAQYEGAALMWERALNQSPGSAAANDFRYRIAAARHHAWLLDPVRERAVAALSATSEFLVHEPPGARRDEASGWLEKQRWGATRATYR